MCGHLKGADVPIVPQLQPCKIILHLYVYLHARPWCVPCSPAAAPPSSSWTRGGRAPPTATPPIRPRWGDRRTWGWFAVGPSRAVCAISCCRRCSCPVGTHRQAQATGRRCAAGLAGCVTCLQMSAAGSQLAGSCSSYSAFTHVIQTSFFSPRPLQISTHTSPSSPSAGSPVEAFLGVVRSAFPDNVFVAAYTMNVLGVGSGMGVCACSSV